MKQSLARLAELEARLDRIGQLLQDHRLDVQRALEYSVDDPRGSLNKSRIVVECIVRDVYCRVTGNDPQRKALGAMVSHAEFRKAVSQRILEYIEFIQGMGNLGSHPGHSVYSGEAQRTFDALCAVLEWYEETYAPRPPQEPAQPSGSPPRPGRRRKPAVLLLLFPLLAGAALTLLFALPEKKPEPEKAVAAPQTEPQSPPSCPQVNYPGELGLGPTPEQRQQAQRLNQQAGRLVDRKLGSLRNFAGAIELWRKVVALDAHTFMVYGNLAFSLYMEKRYQEGIEATAPCPLHEKNVKNRAACFHIRALCFEQLGCLSEARVAAAASLALLEDPAVRKLAGRLQTATPAAPH